MDTGENKKEINLTVRKAEERDIPRILAFYEAGRAHMRAEGNAVQWAGEDGPESKVPEDIRKGISYVVIDDAGQPRAVFAFIPGEDPTYRKITDGAWPDDEPYGTIHRIASDQKTKGILKTAVEYCLTQTDHLRIDTHEKNKTMRAALAKLGFRRAGIITVEDGTPRIAFYLTEE